MTAEQHPIRGPVADLVARELDALSIVDVHTHLFDPGMGGGQDRLLLTGIDEILTYHYHLAELFRVRPDLDPEEFAGRPRTAQADLVWRELFVERGPLSEVSRGVCELLHVLGLDPGAVSLDEARAYHRNLDRRELVDRIFELAGLHEVCMTNDPLDPVERSAWERGFDRDPRFAAALRLDSAIMNWPQPVAALQELGVDVVEELGPRTMTALRGYLVDWHRRMDARYMAVSLPPILDYPRSEAPWLKILVEAVIPAAREIGTPVALMIGVRRAVNPRLGMAGDGLGPTDVEALERLLADHQDVRFLVTLLARESQHALCIAARKFANLTPFGCWWFLNNEAMVDEITRMRLDLLGPSFVPQHSDARVLEQLVFKWRRSRRWLRGPLTARYEELDACGRTVDQAMVQGDLQAMLGRGFG